MLDHIFLSVSDIDRSIAFYTAALAPLAGGTLLPGINDSHIHAISLGVSSGGAFVSRISAARWKASKSFRSSAAIQTAMLTPSTFAAPGRSSAVPMFAARSSCPISPPATPRPQKMSAEKANRPKRMSIV